MSSPLKVAVYAICKNEEKHVGRFMGSCRDADHVIFADTGSTDRTADEFAIECRARYDSFHRINVLPFRFDDARNVALALVPPDVDVCIAMDLDETLEPGWRVALEAEWRPNTARGWITFEGPGAQPFQQNNRVHSRHGWRWRFPCHEALVRSASDGFYAHAHMPNFIMRHSPDLTKPRPDYLKMLEWGIAQEGSEPRMMFYYARELMFRHQWAKSLMWFNLYLETLAESVKSGQGCMSWPPSEVVQARAMRRICEKALAEGSTNKSNPV